MAHRTAPPSATAALAEHPVDIATMRVTARRLLAEDAELPGVDELETLTLLLRGHIMLLIPEVEKATLGLPKDDIPRYCALACTGEARGRLRERPNPVRGGAVAHARRLARTLNALVDHYENLTGAQR